jgi:hypothetical protein
MASRRDPARAKQRAELGQAIHNQHIPELNAGHRRLMTHNDQTLCIIENQLADASTADAQPLAATGGVW